MKNVIILMVSVALAFAAGYYVSGLNGDQHSSANSSNPRSRHLPLLDELDKPNQSKSEETLSTVTSNEMQSLKSSFTSLDELATEIFTLTNARSGVISFTDAARMYSIVSDLDESQLLNLITQYFNDDDPEHNTALFLTFGRYAELNPQYALRFAQQEVSSTIIKIEATNIALAHLALIDPLEAFDIFTKIRPNMAGLTETENMRVNHSWSTIFENLYKKNSNLAIDKLRQLHDDGKVPRNAVYGLTSSLEISQDYQDLLTMVESIDDFSVYSTIVSDWTRSHPREAANWLSNDYSGDRHRELRQDVIRSWTYVDPIESANWLVDSAEGNSLKAEVASLMSNWGRSDPQSALSWFSQQEPTVFNQASFTEFIESTTFMSPEFAEKQMQYIKNESARSRVASQIYTSLKRKSNSAAQSFFEKSPYKSEILEYEKLVNKLSP